MLNAKDARQKKALEDLIAGKWNKLKSSKAVPMDELRKFVSLFGSLFDVGKEARFVTDLSKEQLSSAPAFDLGKLQQ